MFTVIEETSLERLADTFIEHVSAPRTTLSPALRVAAAEWVITPSFGMRRWLTGRTATRLGAIGTSDGIVANWRNEFPSKLTSRVLDLHLERTTGLLQDPWHLTLLQFSLYEWAVTHPMAPGSPLLQGPDGQPLLSRARQMADLFDRYFTWRPDMIRAWCAGSTTTGMTSNEYQQMAVFLGVRSVINVASPPERWSEAWGQLPDVVDRLPAPDRCTLFATSSLPGGIHYVEALHYLQGVMDVTVFMQAPLSSIPAAIATPLEFVTPGLRLWGAAALETSKVCRELRALTPHDSTQVIPTHCAPQTTLEAVQWALVHDEIRTTPANDASVVIHGCFGDTRQAEVLRDAILHELEDDGRTEADILVVCPSLERFAPLIQTAFGGTRFSAHREDSGEPTLAYTIVNPTGSTQGLYLQSVRRFLELVASRCTRSDVLSFFQEPNVMRALGFTEESAELHESWTASSGVRWGLSDDHRQYLGLGQLGDVNTWKSGLRRIALGVMVENPALRSSRSLLPVEVAPQQLSTYAALARAIDYLTQAEIAHRSTHTLTEWLAWFDHWRDCFLVASADEAREEERVLAALTPLRTAALRMSSELPYSDFRALLVDAFDGIGSLGSLLTGGVTITSPLALPQVPFASVYIVGLDDQAFVAPDWETDDLRRDHHERGDISPSDEMRERLRGCILQARERLTITYNAVDVVSAKAIEPGMALSEFADVLQAVTPLEAWGGKDQLEEPLFPFLVKHARNSFSLRNFSTIDASMNRARHRGVFKGSWSFSQLQYTILTTTATTSMGDHHMIPARETSPVTTVTLSDIASFLKNPPEVFVRNSLGIRLSKEPLDHPDDLVGEMSPFPRSTVIRPLLAAERAAVHGQEPTSLAQSLRDLQVSGDAPPSPIVNTDDILSLITDFGREYRSAIGDGNLASLGFRHTLQGTIVDGRITYFTTATRNKVIEVISATVTLGKLITPWLHALALARVSPVPVDLVIIYASKRKKEQRSHVKVESFVVSENHELLEEVLATLVDLYQKNLAQPLPYCVHFDKPELTDEIWRNIEFKPPRKQFLGDPYWEICFGDLAASDILRDVSPTGFSQLLSKMQELFERAIPLMGFLERYGKDK